MNREGRRIRVLDKSNAFNIVKCPAVFKELATRAPGVTPSVLKYYRGTSAKVVFVLALGKRRTILSMADVRYDDALGPAPPCNSIKIQFA